jgi:NAD(P)-dependent dehydrogenase (short-subunit alcohol dehydrogenase family)
MTSFARKVALITGAGSGIGRELALQLGQLGATVVATDLDAGLAEATARASGGHAHGLDVRNQGAFTDLVTQARATHGRIDYLFNNAGVALSGEQREVVREDWDRVLGVNLFGVINGVTAVYPIMLEQGHGHIINTASLAGLTPFPMAAIYAASKHAVVGLSISLRAEAASHGVRVSALCPGFIETPIYDHAKRYKASAAQLVAALPVRPHPVYKTVRGILRGVQRNDALILVPAHARLLYWAYLLLGPVYDRIAQRSVARYRAQA